MVKYKAQGRYNLGWSDAHALYGQREDLRVSASENGINQIQTIGQRINGALSKMVSK
jgi:hypothetical protein